MIRLFALFTLYLSTASSVLFAQTLNWKTIPVSEAVQKYVSVNEKYIITPTYQMNIFIASYENYTTPTPFETSSGFFQKQNNFYCSSLLGYYTMQNEGYKIVIDSSDRTISVANPTEAFISLLSMPDIDKLFEYYAIVKYAVSMKAEYYRIEYKMDNDIVYYEYVINPDGWVQQITMYYNRKISDSNGRIVSIRLRLQISFSGISENVSKTNEDFNEKKYFLNNAGQLLPAAKYKSFQVLDQRVISE